MPLPLLSCPFCGGTQTVLVSTNFGKQLGAHNARIMCRDCKTLGPAVIVKAKETQAKKRELAGFAWNTRADSTTTPKPTEEEYINYIDDGSGFERTVSDCW